MRIKTQAHGLPFVSFCRQGHCISQAGLSLSIFLSQPPECWHYRQAHRSQYALSFMQTFLESCVDHALR